MSASVPASGTNLLIKNATVCTLDDRRRIIHGGGVALDGGRILAVDDSAVLERRYPQFTPYDATGKAVLPGFINAHTHTVLLVLRGTVEDMDGDAVYGYMNPISFAMTPGERTAMARLGCVEAIRSGTTTLADPFRHVAGYAQGMVDSGLRLFLSESGADARTLDIRKSGYKYDRAFGEESLERVAALVEGFHGKENGRVQCQIAAHAPDTCSPWMLDRLLDLARKHGLRRTIHLSQSMGEVEQVRAVHGITPSRYLDENGWLGPDLLAAHWTFCSDEDIALLAERGVHMAHCPANSSRRGPHRVRIGSILDAGVNVALATDNMTEDIFHTQKIGLIIHRGGRGGGVNPSPQDILDGVTRNAAKALGCEDRIGSIEPGKIADLSILDLNRAHLRPIINLTSNLVHYGHPGAVESVLVEGEFVLREGRIVTMDEDDVVSAAQEATVAAWHRLHETNRDIPLPEGLRIT